MRILLYILLFVTLFSCVRNDKEKTHKTNTDGALEISDANEEEAVEAAATITEPIKKVIDVDPSVFKSILENVKTKTLPLTDTTNFDTFKDDKFLSKQEVEALQLENIYPDFYKEGHNYKVVASYKIEDFKNFHALVVTVLKGEHEMETILINYDLNGKILDQRVIAYDEIAEGYGKIESKITHDFILKINTFKYENDTRQVLWTFRIDTMTGNIVATESSNKPFVEHVLEYQTDINRLNIKEELVTTQTFFDNPENIVLLIPEIEDEGEGFFELNSHIFLVDNATKTINTKFYESYQTSGWVSDAIELRSIEINKEFYPVTDSTTAFAVKTTFIGLSRANPYQRETISLFVKSGDSLKKVLDNYTINEFSGQYDGDCIGEFLNEEKALSMFQDKNNGYYDILVAHTITETIEFKDENGDCDSKDTVTNKASVLKFDGKTYK